MSLALCYGNNIYFCINLASTSFRFCASELMVRGVYRLCPTPRECRDEARTRCFWVFAERAVHDLHMYLLITVLCLALAWVRVKRPSHSYTSTQCACRSESKKAAKHHLLPSVEWFSLFQPAVVPTSAVFLKTFQQCTTPILYSLIESYARNGILVMW